MPNKGLTLKMSRLEFADCNSTITHLGVPPGNTSLNLAPGSEYTELYKKLATKGLKFEVLKGQPGKVLYHLRPAYHGNRYWHRYFGREETESYSEMVWEKIVPIEALVAIRPDASTGAASAVKVSSQLRVFLYPFGWSTWISLLVTGEHRLEDLAKIANTLAREPAYRLNPGPLELQTLRQVFRFVAKGVWDDVFGGGTLRAFSPPDVLSVTTVLDKFGGAPALQALSPEHEDALRRLTSPTDGGSIKPLNDLRRDLPLGKGGAGNLDYALQDGMGVFLWVDHLLKSDDRNRRLACYHNNTFLALLHAWQIVTFLGEATAVRNPSSALAELVAAAVKMIKQPAAPTPRFYRNVCLVSYLQRPEVQSASHQ